MILPGYIGLDIDPDELPVYNNTYSPPTGGELIVNWGSTQEYTPVTDNNVIIDWVN